MDNTGYNDIVQSWIKTIEQNYYADTELALKTCEELISYGTETEDSSLVALGYYHKGVAYYIRNEGNQFYQAITEALSHLSITDDWELLARCYNFLGIFSENRGNAALGMDYYLTAINACNVAGINSFKYTVMVNMSVLNIVYGRYDDAIEMLEEAKTYFLGHKENPRYKDHIISVYQNLAKAYLYNGSLDKVKSCFENIYAQNVDFLDNASMISIWAIEAMYYDALSLDKECEERIAKIHEHMTGEFPIMDMFDDICDYCKILIERDKQKELYKIHQALWKSVKKLDIANVVLKTLEIEIEYYRKQNLQEKYQKTAALYYEYSLRNKEENRYTMYNVLNLRKTLELVNNEKRKIAEANILLQKKSETDALTGLNNRFSLNTYSEKEFQTAFENRESLAVEILDFDNFKGYNDSLGHQMGDECIQNVSKAIQTMEEFGAYVARYGGDEFILIYRNKTKEEISAYAKELKKRVLDLNIEYRTEEGIKQVTISQGICWGIPVRGNRMWDYLHMADDMLYRVKQKNRNDFCICSLSESHSNLRKS